MTEAKKAEGRGVTFQMVSDIRLEFKGCCGQCLKYQSPRLSFAYLVQFHSSSPCVVNRGRWEQETYAGDFTYKQFLLKADRFKHVIVLPGNHEYNNQASFAQANQDLVRRLSGPPSTLSNPENSCMATNRLADTPLSSRTFVFTRSI